MTEGGTGMSRGRVWLEVVRKEVKTSEGNDEVSKHGRNAARVGQTAVVLSTRRACEGDANLKRRSAEGRHTHQSVHLCARTLKRGERSARAMPPGCAAAAAAGLAGVRGLLSRQRLRASASSPPGVGPGSGPSAARCRVRDATGFSSEEPIFYVAARNRLAQTLSEGLSG